MRESRPDLNVDRERFHESVHTKKRGNDHTEPMDQKLPPTFLVDLDNNRVVELGTEEERDRELAQSEHTSSFVSGDTPTLTDDDGS
jgi:hypothetical protein